MNDIPLFLTSAVPLFMTSALFEFFLITGVWIVSNKMKNAALIDVAWSGSFCFVALIYALLGSGAAVRRIAFTVMVTCWSLRLAIHLFNRIKSEKKEDARYADMRKEWGDNAERNFFGMFQFQALTVIVLSTPFLISSLNSYPTLRFSEYFGIFLFCIALAGEMTADQQLKEFKSDSNNHGEVCNVGLWRYSRHPNYFFEWITWCAFFIFAVRSPFGAWAVVSPAVMLLFLTKMSGIPMAEKQSLKSKGEKYVRYQHTTSAFVPWFRRSA